MGLHASLHLLSLELIIRARLHLRILSSWLVSVWNELLLGERILLELLHLVWIPLHAHHLSLLHMQLFCICKLILLLVMQRLIKLKLDRHGV
jgi:hypothetical protein